MNIDDFWCRAFLAAMGGSYATSEWENHGTAAGYCMMAANAATRMALCERRLEPRPDGTRHVVDELDSRVMVDEEAPGADLPADPPRPAPTLERVEFTAERFDHGQWILRALEVGGSILVVSGRDTVNVNGSVVHIKWVETSSPTPIEVWLERPATSPAAPGMSDAEVAAEFYRRFEPISSLFGTYGRRVAAADTTQDGAWYSETSAAGANREDHRDSGAPGFVAAVLRARELVRKGGGA